MNRYANAGDEGHPPCGPRVRTVIGRMGQLSAPHRSFMTLVVMISLICSSVSSTRADGQEDPSSQRESVRARRAELAGQIDMARADDSEVLSALKILDDNVRAEQARVDDAERERDDAMRQAADAREAAATKAAALRGIRARVAVIAVDSYVNPPGEAFLDRYKAQSAQQAAEKHAFLESRMGSSADVLDELRMAAHELDSAVAHADEVAAQAEQRRQQAQQRLEGLAQARSEQQSLAAQANERLESKLAEAAALASYDQSLSAQLAASQADLSAELARIGSGPLAGSDAPALSEPVSASASTVPPTPTPGVGPGRTTTSTTPPATQPTTPPVTRPADPPVIVPPPPSVRLATVGGITVDASIAAQLEALLGAARADGVNLGGHGYRDSSAQIALRRANCGTSNYAIYEMPASSCTPPTARPGTSNHERGLAIDFTYNGGSMASRSNPGYIWLAANASRFGFYNLPSEPWHWSIDGH